MSRSKRGLPSSSSAGGAKGQGSSKNNKRGRKEKAPTTNDSNHENQWEDIHVLPDECLEVIAAQLDHDTLFKCAEVCKTWRDLILRPGGGGGGGGDTGRCNDNFGLTVWKGALMKIVHANADLLADLDKAEAMSPGGGHPKPLTAEQQEKAVKRREKLSALLAARMATTPRPTLDQEVFYSRSGLTPKSGSGQAEEAGGGASSSQPPATQPPTLGASEASPFFPSTSSPPRPRPADASETAAAAAACSNAPTTARDLLTLYRKLHSEACYDCFELPGGGGESSSAFFYAPVDAPMRTTAGQLRLRLCEGCSRNYAETDTPSQRLVTFSDAKYLYCLRDADVAPLPYALDTNPVHPSFAPMRLYRKMDVMEAALGRWGTREALQKEKQRRLLR